MARQTDISELLFPVELRPVYTEMIKNGRTVKVPIQNSQVLVNTENDSPLGVVGKTYRVVTNQEAIDMGKQCCKELLNLDDELGLEVFNAYAPGTKSYCHIDLVHHGFAMNLYDNSTKPEIYLPYVRVTNSYNGTRSLRFDVGFCRKLCLNGVIFETETIQFTFSHLRHELNQAIKFDIKREQFEEIADKFKSTVSDLRSCNISINAGRQVFDTVLGLPAKENLTLKNKQDEDEYCNLLIHVEKCLLRYYMEMEANAYALFNAMTDFASNPPENRFMRRDINAMQRATGVWMHDFRVYLKSKPFVASEYLEHLTQGQAQKPKIHNKGLHGIAS